MAVSWKIKNGNKVTAATRRLVPPPVTPPVVTFLRSCAPAACLLGMNIVRPVVIWPKQSVIHHRTRFQSPKCRSSQAKCWRFHNGMKTSFWTMTP
ncbi:uncharacterized protein [Dendrobates tinctorius]|uniref:uncharacterized protein isoform X2 n=1 Tax=Dendrobates tinctorius TaxID=92724 RepID=UPI003CCA0E93